MEPKVRECREGSQARSGPCRLRGDTACSGAGGVLLRSLEAPAGDRGGREAGLTLPPRVGTKHAQVFVCKEAWPSL